MALGFYADSGFADTLTAGAGFTGRATIAPAGDMELLVEDQLVAPAPAQRRGGHRQGHDLADGHDRLQGRTGPPTVPAAPTGVQAVRRQRLGHGVLDRAGQRRQRDHLLHRHPVPRRHAQPATVVTGTPPATSTTSPG